MIPTRIGQVVSGCMFVGVNQIGKRAYAVLVSPSDTETHLMCKTTNTSTPSTQSVIDGFANSVAMRDSDHPAARYCLTLSVNGNCDFYLPAKNELELCYRALKPSYAPNDTYDTDRYCGNLSTPCGSNNSSIPTGGPYTEQLPKRSIVVNSNFEFTFAWYWTSTESTSGTTSSLDQHFFSGRQSFGRKTCRVSKVRAVRKQLLVES